MPPLGTCPRHWDDFLCFQRIKAVAGFKHIYPPFKLDYSFLVLTCQWYSMSRWECDVLHCTGIWKQKLTYFFAHICFDRFFLRFRLYWSLMASRWDRTCLFYSLLLWEIEKYKGVQKVSPLANKKMALHYILIKSEMLDYINDNCTGNRPGPMELSMSF